MSFLVGQYSPAFTLASKGGGTRFAQGLSGAMQRATSELAQYAQNLTVQNLKDSIERPSTSTGRLEEVVASAANRDSSVNGFAVGFVELMDREVRYWRNIEEGTQGRTHYAREVWGFFRTPGLAPASSAAGGVIQGPQRGRSDGRLIETEPNGGHGKFQHHIFIHDIRPHDFYFDAWEQMRQQHTIRTIVSRNFKDAVDPITGFPADWAAIIESAGL